MFQIGGALRGYRGSLVTLGVLALSTVSQAATVGQWSGNASSTVWASSGNFSSFYSAATATNPGHKIETPEAITTAALANNSHFIIAVPQSAPTASEVSALRSWVMGGGILLLMADPVVGSSATSTINDILVQLGSSMVINTTTRVASSSYYTTYGSFAGTDEAVIGPPTDLTGKTLSTLTFSPISGGTGLSTSGAALNNLIRYGNLTSGGTVSIGQVYVFGNATLASNTATSTNANNRAFFFNLLGSNLTTFGTDGGGGGGGGGGGSDNPEPASVTLMVAGLAGLVWYRRRQARS